MNGSKNKQLRIGSVVEININNQFAYAQYAGKHPEYGDGIYVIYGLYDKRPDDLSILGKLGGYLTFYPAKAAVSHKLIKVVGHISLLPDAEIPSRVRRPNGWAKDGTIFRWLIKGSGFREIRDDLSEDEKKLPITAIWNHEFLVDRIAEGWRPEYYGQPISKVEKRSQLCDSCRSDNDVGHQVEHYLYFPVQSDALTVAGILRANDYFVENRLGADSVNWLVLVREQIIEKSSDPDKTKKLLEKLSEEYSGEYDGWETEI